ncbi:ROK family transcriptional regulator [Paenarthrobacter sp. Z7-10]|uniref:ROK family transcriptional regulator n=1 Tax=Paenarthrobacter sp. Z7-10 TaxID=2787635 RepID=UPI0022A9D193|nr:ROK family transcriptional regulator [Paenarthrobacter sp. Z7-10]MCZ2402143.1 ROK family transcriptional regulator [Paenarthrobacter sp. Z7-10]
MTETSAATARTLRRLNAGIMLEVMRSPGAVTGTDLMQATGLSRATVMAICEDLMKRGWVQELDNQRTFGGYRTGRPARRFELNVQAGYVLGIDIGAAKTTVVLADLRGGTVARASLPFRGRSISAQERVEVVNQAAMAALAHAGTVPSKVLAAGAGLAAPIDREGNVVAAQPFWGMFDVGLRAALLERHGWTVLLENDANLAALGERWHGAAVGVDDLAVLLASERFGAGLMESGRLLHGSRGSAGEMAYLDLLAGVGSPAGIAQLARQWAVEALAGTGPTLLKEQSGGSPGAVNAEMVFAAAALGDKAAGDILERLTKRIARIIASLGTLFNPELVVIGGAVSASAGVLLPGIAAQLPLFTATPPRVAVSTLGDEIVSVGAVRHALDYVERNALDLELAATPA